MKGKRRGGEGEMMEERERERGEDNGRKREGGGQWQEGTVKRKKCRKMG